MFFNKRKKAKQEEIVKSAQEQASHISGEFAENPLPVIEFSPMPLDVEIEDSKLCEITDKAVISRISQLIPGMFQIMTDVKNIQHVTKTGGTLHRVVLPARQTLDKSRAIEGAVRGTFRGADGKILGNANWIEVSTDPNNLQMMNAVSSVMNVASLVIGQYYMSKINSELDGISEKITDISGFLNAEYKSKIMMLTAKIKQLSQFQIDVIENSEHRKHEQINLQSLENDCVQLLGQAGLTLHEITKLEDLDYDKYEGKLKESFEWSSYQLALYELLYKIAQLKYTLGLGMISKEQCFFMHNECEAQVRSVREKLLDWNEKQVVRLEIDVNTGRRKKQAIEGLLFKLPGMIKDELNYSSVKNSTIQMITKQTMKVSQKQDSGDCFNEDVNLVVKEGKLYYLPT